MSYCTVSPIGIVGAPGSWVLQSCRGRGVFRLVRRSPVAISFYSVKYFLWASTVPESASCHRSFRSILMGFRPWLGEHSTNKKIILCRFITIKIFWYSTSPSLSRSSYRLVNAFGLVFFFSSWYAIWKLKRERYSIHCACHLPKFFFDIKYSRFFLSDNTWMRLSTDSSSACYSSNTRTIYYGVAG